MKTEKIQIAKIFTHVQMNQEQLEAAREEWLAVKETGRHFNRLHCIGKTEGFMQSRNPGSVTLDLSQPYQKRMYSPLDRPTIPVKCGVEEAEVERPKSMANFRIDAVSIVRTYYSEDRHEVSVKLCIDMTDDEGYPTGNIFFLEVPLEQYRSLAKYLIKKHPQCVIYDDDVFAKRLAEIYRQLEQKEDQYIFKFAGWIRDRDGRLKFLHSAMPNVDSDVFLQSDFDMSLQFLPVYWRLAEDKGKLLILLLWVLWAGLARFWEEVGLETKGLRAVLYLSAPSGTGKTTLSSLLLRGFERANCCLRFEDTGPNIEETLLKRRDVPSLVDDFYAQGSKQADSEYEKKASSLARIAGDGFLRGKLAANRQLRPDRKFRGSIICTGEYVSLNTHSSVLRCWQLFFPKNSIVLGEDMDYLTRNIAVVRAFMAGWIDFLETNQKNILLNLPGMLQMNEKVAKAHLTGCKYARLITHTAALLTINDLLDGYLHGLGIAGQGLETSRDLILVQATEQLSVVEELSPAEIWINCVRSAVDSGRLNLAEDEAAFRQNPCDGYITDGVLYCISGKLDDLIMKMAYERRLGLKITETVKRDVAERGVLLTASGEFTHKYSKKRRPSPHRPRMYSIVLKED